MSPAMYAVDAYIALTDSLAHGLVWLDLTVRHILASACDDDAASGSCSDDRLPRRRQGIRGCDAIGRALVVRARRAKEPSWRRSLGRPDLSPTSARGAAAVIAQGAPLACPWTSHHGRPARPVREPSRRLTLYCTGPAPAKDMNRERMMRFPPRGSKLHPHAAITPWTRLWCA